MEALVQKCRVVVLGGHPRLLELPEDEGAGLEGIFEGHTQTMN